MGLEDFILLWCSHILRVHAFTAYRTRSSQSGPLHQAKGLVWHENSAEASDEKVAMDA